MFSLSRIVLLGFFLFTTALALRIPRAPGPAPAPAPGGQALIPRIRQTNREEILARRARGPAKRQTSTAPYPTCPASYGIASSGSTKFAIYPNTGTSGFVAKTLSGLSLQDCVNDCYKESKRQ